MRLHHFQSQAIKASVHEQVPFVLMLSGVQGGKTVAGSAWELIQWQKWPKDDHLILAPTYKVLQQSTLRKLDAIIPKGWATFNKADAVYDLAWGGKAFVRSLEDPDSIEGISAKSVWGDEAGRYTVRAWENIQARRSATKGSVFLTTTPYGLNWLKFQFYDLAMQGLPEYRVVHFRSIDSPHFPKEEWERAKRDMPKKVFRRKFGGLFTPLEGLIYEDFDAQTMEVPLPAVPSSWEKIGGIDHGHSSGHPCAVSIWASPNFRDRNAKVYKVGEWKKSGMLLSEVWQVMRNLMTFSGPVTNWYADPSAAQENAELGKLARDSRARNEWTYDFKLRGAVNSVDWGIEQVQGLMKQDRYRLVVGRCAQTKDELAVYARDEKDRIIKENDHCMDADRYALATHMREPKRIQVH